MEELKSQWLTGTHADGGSEKAKTIDSYLLQISKYLAWRARRNHVDMDQRNHQFTLKEVALALIEQGLLAEYVAWLFQQKVGLGTRTNTNYAVVAFLRFALMKGGFNSKQSSAITSMITGRQTAAKKLRKQADIERQELCDIDQLIAERKWVTMEQIAWMMKTAANAMFLPAVQAAEEFQVAPSEFLAEEAMHAMVLMFWSKHQPRPDTVSSLKLKLITDFLQKSYHDSNIKSIKVIENKKRKAVVFTIPDWMRTMLIQYLECIRPVLVEYRRKRGLHPVDPSTFFISGLNQIVNPSKIVSGIFDKFLQVNVNPTTLRSSVETTAHKMNPQLADHVSHNQAHSASTAISYYRKSRAESSAKVTDWLSNAVGGVDSTMDQVFGSNSASSFGAPPPFVGAPPTHPSHFHGPGYPNSFGGFGGGGPFPPYHSAQMMPYGGGGGYMGYGGSGPSSSFPSAPPWGSYGSSSSSSSASAIPARRRPLQLINRVTNKESKAKSRVVGRKRKAEDDASQEEDNGGDDDSDDDYEDISDAKVRGDDEPEQPSESKRRKVGSKRSHKKAKTEEKAMV
jgi:hypothetical protein